MNISCTEIRVKDVSSARYPDVTHYRAHHWMQTSHPALTYGLHQRARIYLLKRGLRSPIHESPSYTHNTYTMATAIYNTLAHYATPPHNYIGTTIFLSYILVALYATLTLTYSLRKQYTTVSISHLPAISHNEKARLAQTRYYIKIYVFLASISFASLSYYMPMFLVTQFLEWKRHDTNSGRTWEGVKRWMLDSSLFQDFAKDLVRDAPNAVCTQSAILATWFWNIWMARKVAKEHNINTSTMRPYILLSQILPISFTITLFIIQIHLSSTNTQTQPPAKHSPHALPSNPHRNPIALLQLPNILLNVSLLLQPTLQHVGCGSTEQTGKRQKVVVLSELQRAIIYTTR
ncbi:hypothetical protein BDW02DRAFT_224142 [Decorospora gaudefroyi]|uniref:Uncharacterized protein n=1 Tax=Decorospora gaudefroyi TaxID=184978 RepID=A0A6A5JVR2_9PLEO|nr:hypothetical protein BDW02DRAFT_224142 [Decorospora gaudefroyi]